MRILRLLYPFVRVSAALAIFSAGPAVIGQTGAEPSGTVLTGTSDYLLRPADVLQIKVFQEDDLTREVSISQEYTISLPLIGTIDIRNRSVRQVEDIVRQLYDRDFIVNPQVTVIVLKYAERSVNVMGSVNSPQAVPFPPERGLTLLEAIARAGGFSRLANRSAVVITRTDEKGASKTFTVDAEKLIGGKSANLWPLQVNDVVHVPEKFL